MNLQPILDAALEVNREVSADLLKFFNSRSFTAVLKKDGTPVTDADTKASEVYEDRLHKIFPVPVVSEENVETLGMRLEADDYWLIDPLDGTREFIRGHDSFTSNVALILKRKLAVGIMSCPAKNEFYWAEATSSAYKNGHRIENTRQDAANIVAFSSRSHSDGREQKFHHHLAVTDVITMGSALKLCYLAEGIGDVYLRFRPTWEWDTAAGQLILERAGCRLLDLATLQPITYGKTNRTNGGFLGLRNNLEFDPHYLANH